MKLKIEKDVTEWNQTMSSVPSWKQILEFEYIRQTGKLNMITDNVQRWAYDNGLYNVVNWYELCRENKTSPLKMYGTVITSFEEKMGPRSTWITSDVKARYNKISVQSEIQKLTMRLQELKDNLEHES